MADDRYNMTSSSGQESRQEECGILYTDEIVEEAPVTDEPVETLRARMAVPPHQRKNFQGYTLSELRYRRALTSLKIDMAKERLRLLTSPKMQSEAQAMTGYVKGAQTILRYVDYALLAYNVTRKVSSVFRRLGFRKSK